MPIAFGSVGDIITLSLLIKELVKSLDESRGSTAQYQAVIRELWTLDRALLQVELVFQSCDKTPELTALSATANQCAEQCRMCIVEFRDRIKKYHQSLSVGGSGSAFKDVARKICWRAFVKDHVVVFRDRVNAHSMAMNMLLATASVNLLKLNDERLHQRLEQSGKAHEDATTAQTLSLYEITSRLSDTNASIETGQSEIRALGSRIDLSYLQDVGTKLLSLVQEIWRINLLTFSMIVSLQNRIPSGLGGCWKQEPVTLEDALGRIFPIPLELINSWMALYSILEARFRDLPGHRKILQRQYCLRSDSLNKDLEQSVAFTNCVFPGQHISMSMIFHGKSEKSVTSCPGCELATCRTEEELRVQIKCCGCGMWYQRITEAASPLVPDVDALTIPQHVKRLHDFTLPDDDDPKQFRRVRLKCNWQDRAETIQGDEVRSANDTESDFRTVVLGLVKTVRRESDLGICVESHRRGEDDMHNVTSRKLKAIAAEFERQGF